MVDTIRPFFLKGGVTYPDNTEIVYVMVQKKSAEVDQTYTSSVFRTCGTNLKNGLDHFQLSNGIIS